MQMNKKWHLQLDYLSPQKCRFGLHKLFILGSGQLLQHQLTIFNELVGMELYLNLRRALVLYPSQPSRSYQSL